ncbi:MAG: MATE family efflux transporter [Eubacteriales bacterium]|nr:MATE family efflux transporter [Eubacteriales bacterium]
MIYKDSSFYKKVLGISVPIALQSLITTGVNVMDTIMIGAVGETQLSAVSLANQFINIYHILCMGIGMGASVLVARFFGMGEQKAVRKTIAIMLRFCLGIATLFCLVTAAAPHFVMHIYTEEKPIIAEGMVYLKWSVITYYLLGLSLTCTIVLRNVGKTTMPLYTSIGAFFLNVGANYIFIFGKLGMPAMGVAGAALGTLVARIFECGVICGFLFFREDRIAFRIPKPCPRFPQECSARHRQWCRWEMSGTHRSPACRSSPK